MNKIFKLIGWGLGVVGIVLAILCLLSSEGGNVDLLLRFTYVLFIASVVIWIGLSIILTGINNPKGLVKAGIFLVIGAAVVFAAYMLASGAPALNVKTQPSEMWLKLTDTLMSLVYILGVGAIVAIIYGVIKNVISK